MKLTEADYYAKNGALFKKNDVGFSGIKKLVLTENTLSGSLFDGFSPDTLILLEFPVTFACCDSETFDEAFLADLRSVLKQLEETGKTVVFSVTGKIVGADDSAVFYHIARRIKDCKSVAGICFQAGTTKGTAMSVIDALQKNILNMFTLKRSADFMMRLTPTLPVGLPSQIFEKAILTS